MVGHLQDEGVVDPGLLIASGVDLGLLLASQRGASPATPVLGSVDSGLVQPR